MTLIGIVEVVLLMGLVAIASAVVVRFVRVPLSLPLILFSFVTFEVLTRLGYDTGIRAHSFQDLVFFVLLPVLIFEAAYNINQVQLLKSIAPILLLAVMGLVISTVVTAVGVFYGIGHATGFPFIAALITGALLAATDPVAVVSQLKELQAPDDIEVLIEGESLFNDATAIVLFTILVAAATGGTAPMSPGDGIIRFFIAFIGGALVGMAVGTVAIGLCRILHSFVAVGMISIVAAYGSFFVAEHLLHVSGVMGVLLAGLLLGRDHQRHAQQETRNALAHVWELLSYLFNLVVFVLLGIVITTEMFTKRWLAMLIAIAAVFVARIASVYISTFLSEKIFSVIVPPNYKPVLVWGGLRGVVTIALVFSLPVELEYWWTIQSMAFGVVLFTLIVQAPSNKWLLRRMRII